jgi:hypothetical protein
VFNIKDFVEEFVVGSFVSGCVYGTSCLGLRNLLFCSFVNFVSFGCFRKMCSCPQKFSFSATVHPSSPSWTNVNVTGGPDKYTVQRSGKKSLKKSGKDFFHRSSKKNK